jgi:CHRD domain-containing protein
MKNWLAVVSLGVVAGFAVSAAADDNDHGGFNRAQRVFRAELVGFSEVPSVSTAAHGRFYAVLNKEETELSYWLNFSGLTVPTSQSHIHFGQHHVNGGIVVWLCEGTLQSPAASTPACGPTGSTEGEVSGVITATEVVGLGVGTINQGISPGEFAELIAAMRAGAAYANVHSGSVAPVTTPPTPNVGFPGGEIRGQIH